MRGDQQPRVMSVPRPDREETAAEALELLDAAGLRLDEWQRLVLHASLGERTSGKWSAFEIGLMVSRQNGKGALLEARELVGLFIIGEKLIIHSAHLFSTSMEHFRRVEERLASFEVFRGRVKRISRSHGDESITLKTGQRLNFKTRTKGGGRGYSADLVVFDEAMFLPEAVIGALMPTLSARPNPQLWYTGSAVDQMVSDSGLVFARIRRRGHTGSDPSLAYFEWSADFDNPSLVAKDDATDPRLWAVANPALGIRISDEYVQAEQRSMDPRTFAVERLGVGDWPMEYDADSSIIELAVWKQLEDATSAPTDPVVFAFDVAPDRSYSTIAVAGARPDGRVHVEIAKRERGTGWLLDQLPAMVARNEPAMIVCDGAGPVASLLPHLQALDITTVTAREHAEAAGGFLEQITEGRLRHIGQRELTEAIKAAATRPLGDAWAWSRRQSGGDISPLVAASLATWGHITTAGAKPRPVVRAVDLSAV